MVTLGNISVGGSVFLVVKGVPTEFIVVHQGLPSSVYDSSCDGTWVLAKDIYTLRPYDSTDNDYANSDIHAWLNGTFYGQLDSDTQSVVLQAKIPYIKGVSTSESAALMTGANGLSSKVFLLSNSEISSSYASTIASGTVKQGSILNYFSADTNTLRIAYYDGAASFWWLRGPYGNYAESAAIVQDTGSPKKNLKVYNDYGIRPAMILDPSLMVDASGSIVFTNFRGFANIEGVWRELSGGFSKVNGEWRAVASGFSKIDNSWNDNKQTWAMYAVNRVYEPNTFDTATTFSNPSSTNPYLMASQAKKDGNGNVDWGNTYTATSSTTLRNNFGTYPYCSMSSTLDADSLYKITSVTTSSRQRQQVTGWALTSETVGAYIGDVSAKAGTYPENGAQGDYWYILKE